MRVAVSVPRGWRFTLFRWRGVFWQRRMLCNSIFVSEMLLLAHTNIHPHLLASALATVAAAAQCGQVVSVYIFSLAFVVILNECI